MLIELDDWCITKTWKDSYEVSGKTSEGYRKQSLYVVTANQLRLGHRLTIWFMGLKHKLETPESPRP